MKLEKKSKANNGEKCSGEGLFVNRHHLTKEHLHLALAIFLYAKVDLLVEGDEVGQAAAKSAWYFYVKVVLVSNGILLFPFTALHQLGNQLNVLFLHGLLD